MSVELSLPSTIPFTSDEAYSLAVGGDAATSKDFGREAINELMTVMNDGDPVFIFAGYEAEMQAFVKSNQGLFRRIDSTYHFVDFSVPELATILRYEVKRGGFRIDEGVNDGQLVALLADNTTESMRAKMNGGLCRRLFRAARAQLDQSLSLSSSLDEMTTILHAHLEAAVSEVASVG